MKPDCKLTDPLSLHSFPCISLPSSTVWYNNSPLRGLATLAKGLTSLTMVAPMVRFSLGCPRASAERWYNSSMYRKGCPRTGGFLCCLSGASSRSSRMRGKEEASAMRALEGCPTFAIWTPCSIKSTSPQKRILRMLKKTISKGLVSSNVLYPKPKGCRSESFLSHR